MISRSAAIVFVAFQMLSGCSILDGADTDALDAAKFDQVYAAAESDYTAGNLNEAEKKFNKALSLNPTNSQVLYRLGTISFRKEDMSTAARYFEESVKYDPRSPKAHFNLATIRLMQAENHFKYYIATADPKTDIEGLSRLIGAIEEYASDKTTNK